jgi:hypothetical protein
MFSKFELGDGSSYSFIGLTDQPKAQYDTIKVVYHFDCVRFCNNITKGSPLIQVTALKNVQKCSKNVQKLKNKRGEKEDNGQVHNNSDINATHCSKSNLQPPIPIYTNLIHISYGYGAVPQMLGITGNRSQVHFCSCGNNK